MPSTESRRALSGWYIEKHTPWERHAIQLGRTIYAGRTGYQRVRIAESIGYGKVLILDGDIQSAEADEAIYHESLVHPAMVTHPMPRRVLIMGGGEGATLREVCRHRSVERVLMVDLDGQLVERCQKHLPGWSDGAFQDPRAQFLPGDARTWLDQHDEMWDVIIHDLPQPQIEGRWVPELVRLFSLQCFTMARRRLSPGGMFCMQACSARLGTDHLYRVILNTLSQVFPMVAPAHAYVPSFANDWGFIVASGHADPRLLSMAEVDHRLQERIAGGALRWYHGATHLGLFTFQPGRPAVVAMTIDESQPPPDVGYRPYS